MATSNSVLVSEERFDTGSHVGEAAMAGLDTQLKPVR